MMPSEISVRINHGLSGYQELKEDWHRLALRCGSHFLHFPGWYGAKLADKSSHSQVYLVSLYRDGNLFAVLPFEYRLFDKGPFKIPILQLFYSSEMGVNDVLSSEPLFPYRTKLINTLRQHLPFFAFIRWQSVLENSCAISILSPTENPRHTHTSKFIDFSQGAAAFWSTYSAKFRRTLQRKKNKAEKHGSLQLVCATEPNDLPLAFEQFLEVENSGWKGQRGTSIIKQPQKLAYYQALLAYYGQHGLCQINILLLNDVPIAAQFGARVAQRLYLLKIGYREDFREISPGYLIIEKLVERSAEAGAINCLSFVTGVEWIDRWHPGRQSAGIFYLSNGTLPGDFIVWALLTTVQLKNRYRSPRKQVAVDDADE